MFLYDYAHQIILDSMEFITIVALVSGVAAYAAVSCTKRRSHAEMKKIGEVSV